VRRDQYKRDSQAKRSAAKKPRTSAWHSNRNPVLSLLDGSRAFEFFESPTLPLLGSGQCDLRWPDDRAAHYKELWEPQMTRLWSRLHHYLLSDRDQSFNDRLLATAQLGVRYLKEVGASQLFLRECDVVGEGARIIGGRPRIDNQGYIEIGPRTVLTCEMGPTSLRTGPAGRLSIGESVIMNFGTLISANLSVTVGNFVSIGQYCVIADTEGADSTSEADSAPIEIGDGVWIAARVTVLPGAKIGAGSVVTAGSIVSGEIPAGVVAGGIPARVLRKLAPDKPVGLVPGRSSKGESNGHRQEDAPTAHPAPSRSGVIVSDFTTGDL